MGENTEQQQVAVSPELLTKAGKLPANAPTMTAVNPFEREPRISVGEEIKPGQLIVGYFAESKLVDTPRSKYAKQQWVHVLRIGTPSGEKLGIWGVAELNSFFEGMQAGTLVSILYKERGINGDGNKQHYFELKRSGLQ